MGKAAGEVIVIGGGVIGATCAYYLSKTGWKVTLIERGEFGKGSSHGNCGFLCPSHVLPLTAPGAIAKALKSLFNRTAPFYVKPRLDMALWGWLLQFSRRCNTRDMLQTARDRQPLLNSSMALYIDLMKSEPFDCNFERRGTMYVFKTRDGMKHFEPTQRLLEEQFNLPAKRYDGKALIELEPSLKPGLEGAWHYEMDAHLRPDHLMASWRRILEGRGVKIHENCEAKGFVSEGRQSRAALTNQGEMPADAFVVATGAWTPFLNDHLGCRIPIQPGKGYSITMQRPAKCPATPLIFEEHRVAVTSWKSGYRIGSTMEFSGYDTTLNRRRLDYLKDSARIYLHEPFCDPVEEEWYGWRPMCSDEKPIIGPSPAWGNVMIAAGHCMLGVAMATATGKLVSELLNGETPHVDPRPFAASRF